MSHAHIIDIEAAFPQIPTQFDAQTGSAIPIGNVLNLSGSVVANGTNATPFETSGAGNTVTFEMQLGTAVAGAPADNTDAGIVSFESTQFAVDANGHVTLAGGGLAIDSFTTDVAGPVSPTAGGVVDVTGTSVFSDGTTANTLTLNVQATANTFLYGQGTNTNAAELGPLSNGELIIGSTGVAPIVSSLTAPAAGITITGGAGSITFALANDLAAVEGLGTTGLVSRTAADTWTTTSITDNAVIIGDGGEVVQMVGPLTDGQLLIGSTGATPVANTLASADGSITITNGAGTIDLAVAAADDAILTLTGDTGGALSPTAGNINILGGPGVTVTGSGSTLTVNSVVYTDQTATTLAVDSGTFATAAGAYVLPAAPAIGELVEIVCITTGIVVTANTGQTIQIGGDATSVAGTATNSSKGDSLWLRYRDTDSIWYSLSTTGVWVLA